jgi:hypothetical protein
VAFAFDVDHGWVDVVACTAFAFHVYRSCCVCGYWLATNLHFVVAQICVRHDVVSRVDGQEWALQRTATEINIACRPEKTTATKRRSASDSTTGLLSIALKGSGTIVKTHYD